MAARQEDKAMAGLLRRSLAQDASAGAGVGPGENCPEPEILAAYFDRALDSEDTARYDSHFSRCSLCREQLAAMGRAGGAAGATDAFGAKDAEQKNAGAWGWLTGPGWLMPAAAALAVLLAITGVALRLRKTVEPTSQIAMSRPDALPPANSAPATNPAAPPEGAPPTAVASPPPARTDQFSARLSAPATSRSDTAGVPIARSESGASRELGAQSPPRVVEGAHPATRGLELSRVGAASGGLAGKSAAAPVKQPQPPAPQTSAGMARGAMRAGSGGGVGSGSAGGVGPGTANSADETATVMEAAPLVNTAEPTKVVPEKKAESDLAKTDSQVSVEAETAPQPNARKTRSSATTATAGAAGLAAPSAPAQSAKAMNLAASKATEAAALARMQEAQISSNLMNLQIHTPDPKILWMIAGAGAIEKSEDGGATWKTKDLDTLALILAGAAPSVKICWLVGANATILRTTNGEHWKTIKPPAETDFVRVDATDALTSTVTALDGRKFSTGDGGKSWNNVK